MMRKKRLNIREFYSINQNERRRNESCEGDEIEKLRKRKRKDMEVVWVKFDFSRFQFRWRGRR